MGRGKQTGTANPYAFNLENFTKRPKTLYSHLNEHNSDIWGNSSAFAIATPPVYEDLWDCPLNDKGFMDDSNLKFGQWLRAPSVDRFKGRGSRTFNSNSVPENSNDTNLKEAVADQAEKKRQDDVSVGSRECDCVISGEGATVGIVIRDSSGVLVQAASKCFQGAISVELAEAVAVLEGIQLVLLSDFAQVSIFSDAWGVVELCNGSTISRCEVTNIVVDVQYLLSQYSFLSVDFSPKISNRASHGMARSALGAGFSGIWSVNFLDWICKLVLEDSLGSFVG
ncbi:hypothetical protein ACOSQ2_012139 [Xanthoceras sorbifolium]